MQQHEDQGSSAVESTSASNIKRYRYTDHKPEVVGYVNWNAATGKPHVSDFCESELASESLIRLTDFDALQAEAQRLDDLCAQLSQERDLAKKANQQISPIAMSFLPTDWRMIEHQTHYALVRGNEVVATLAGPNAETNAATLALVLSGITHDADQQSAEVPNV